MLAFLSAYVKNTAEVYLHTLIRNKMFCRAIEKLGLIVRINIRSYIFN